MPVVSLISDWQQNDFYIAAVKGQILSICPQANIVDVNHQLKAFNIPEAAFVLRNSFSHFPKGSIHLLAVSAEKSTNHPHVIVEAEGHYFVGADNGVFGLAIQEKPARIIELVDEERDTTFPEKDILAGIVGRVANGENISSMGNIRESLYRQPPIMAAIDDNVINGAVIYIDSYQNVISNISEDVFERIGKGRKFEIFVQSNHYKIDRINKTYNETSVGELLAVFNSLGLLEIAINKGNAAQLLNLDNRSVVRIKFYD